MSYEENERQALKMANAARIKEQMRRNNNVEDKRIIERKTISKPVLVSFGILALAVCGLALSYATTKSKMKGIKVDPRTGFTYTDTNNSINPTTEEVFEEMFKKNGK